MITRLTWSVCKTTTSFKAKILTSSVGQWCRDFPQSPIPIITKSYQKINWLQEKPVFVEEFIDSISNIPWEDGEEPSSFPWKLDDPFNIWALDREPFIAEDCSEKNSKELLNIESGFSEEQKLHKYSSIQHGTGLNMVKRKHINRAYNVTKLMCTNLLAPTVTYSNRKT